MSAVKRLTASNAELGNAILKFLWDGQDNGEGWQDIDDVLSAVSPLVPPGRAFRCNERMRQRSYKTDKGRSAPEQRVKGSRDLAIIYGKRQIITQSIAGLKTTNWIEIEYDDPEKKRKAYRRIRLVPGTEPIFPHDFVPSLEVNDEGQMLCGSCGHLLRLKYIHGLEGGRSR